MCRPLFSTPFLPIFFAATKNRIGRGAFFYAATKNGIGRRPRGTAGTGTTPAAFYLGLCRLRGTLSPPAPATTNRRRAVPHCSSDDAAAIRKSGLEIKNRCTKEGVNGEKLTSIPKSGPEIKNRCTKEGVNGEKLASIPKFGPEIKNRCSNQAVSGHSLQRLPN